VNNELQGMWKETVAVYCAVMSQNVPGGTEDTHEIPQKIGWCLCLDSNLDPSGYNAKCCHVS